MADPTEIVEPVETLDDAPEVEESEVETAPPEAPEEETPEEPKEEPEELVLSLDGEDQEPEEENVPWVRQLRKERREDKKRIRELERLIAEKTAPAVQSVNAPGEKPTLEGCNFDGEVFEAKLEQWHSQKAKYERQQEETTRKQQSEQDAWNKTLQGYAAERAQISKAVPDFEDAEEAVQAALSVTQQGLILKAPSGDRAKIVAALGKSPKKLAELAAIQDPVDFVYAIAEVKAMIKTQKRTPPPVNDKPVRSKVSGASVVNQQLETLREEARKTGDYSKYFAAKNARA